MSDTAAMARGKPEFVRRRVHEEGHRRKFLVIVDETPECDRAVVYAAKRAERTRGALKLLSVVAPGDFQHWLGVEKMMREEAISSARALLSSYVDRAAEVAAIEPETEIREGAKSEEILAAIAEDADIAILVLAAATGPEGPGPLVSALAGRHAGNYRIPITIVPGDLDDEAIAALA